jgi:cytochrome c peroxidase
MNKMITWITILLVAIVTTFGFAACGGAGRAPSISTPATEVVTQQAPAQEEVAAIETEEEDDEAAEVAQPERGEEAVEIPDFIWQIFAPLPNEVTPTDYALTEELVTLGRMLFYENRLSISQQMSCNTCHLLDHYGVDGRDFSLGHEGKPVGRNSPTVYNAALHMAQFWDGRAATVEEQAKGPVMAAGEMGMPSVEYVEEVLRSIPGYEPFFVAAFPEDAAPIHFDNVAQAIGAFERRLLTPSRFDEFLRGDESQLTNAEKAGLMAFVQSGCVACHSGVAIGGQEYRKIGQVIPYEVEDVGRYEVTGQEEDRHVFKVPSLRNIEMTGPYMHNGSIETLAEMVQIMGKHQLGQELNDDTVDSIVIFLKSLTGEIPEEYIAQPTLPESGVDTPKPGGS